MRSFRVKGPKGGTIAKHATAARIKESLASWVARYKQVKVVQDPSPPPPPKPEDKALQRANELLRICQQFSGPYVYGGGHGPALRQLSVTQGLDCSSSTSLALFRASIFNSSVAQVSGWFTSWGDPGRGKYVTIYANAGHVWVEFNLPNGWHRFDTSPWNDGPRGPRVRTRRRGTSGFVIRHPQGL